LSANGLQHTACTSGNTSTPKYLLAPASSPMLTHGPHVYSEPDREIEEAGDKRERREGREKGSYIHSCRDAYPFPFHMRGRLVRRLVGFWPWLGSGHTLTHPYAHSHIRTHMGPNPCRSSPIATHIALCDASPAPATTNHRDAQPCAILLRRRGRAAWPTLPGAQLVCAE